MAAYMLTTVDNPYNPFEEFDKWYSYDTLNGYQSCERLSNLAKVADGMSAEEVDSAIEDSIDRFIELDFTNLFRKVDANSAKELVAARLSDKFSLEES